MGRKKPEWLQKTQNTFQSGADAIGDGVRAAGRDFDRNVIQPLVVQPIKQVTKAATSSNGGNIAKSIGSLFRRNRFWRMPKPKVVQQVQKAAQKTADKVGQGAKDVAKQTGQAVTKAADKVGDVVRPAAQSVAKEVGHMVNPAICEVALRGKQLAQASAPVLKRIGDKLGDGLREFDKKVVKPTGDYLGDLGRGDIDILGNRYDREAQVKVPGYTMDTGLVDTSGMTPEQREAYERFLAERGVQSKIEDSRWRQDAVENIRRQNEIFSDSLSPRPMPEPMFPKGIIPAIIEAAGGKSGEGGGGSNLPPEGVKVADAGNDGWRSYEEGRQQDRTILDDILDNPIIKPIADKATDAMDDVAEGTEKAAKAGAEGLKTAWETIRPDRIDTRVFKSTFGDWATPEEVQAYTRADHEGNEAEKSRIRGVAEQRRKTKTKPGT